MKRTLLLLLLLLIFYPQSYVFAATQQSGSTGLEATVKGNPPTQAPTISSPGNGQSFSTIPITVNGLCQTGMLVEVFKNNVFAGSRECVGGSYSIQIDLFSGKNDLVARDYDGLNQVSPDSNIVTVNFDNALPSTVALVTLTSQYAKRGADPGTVLTWPISLSGGTGPYAISVDWGDGSKLDLISQQFPGLINLQHTYKTSGSFNITIKATDSTGNSAFLQVVGIGNGPTQQNNANSNSSTIKIVRVVPIWALVALLVLTALAFWLGKRHQVQTIQARLRAGQPPFGKT